MIQPIETYGFSQLPLLMDGLGQPAFRAKQLGRWIYKQGVSSYAEMTNLPASLREALQQDYPLHIPRIANKELSSDGSRKYVLELFDGTLVETVGMPSTSEDNHLSVCISTQAGCPMACAFCATGHAGFFRNLLPGEMAQQVLAVQRDYDTRVTNVVAMGQGEPFLNYDNVISALEIINSEDGCRIGARHITVSTCGIIPRITEFSQLRKQYTLAVSLHSALQPVRDRLMPKCANTPLPQLKKALIDYTREDNRRVSLEYLLIDSVNDGEKDLRALISFCDSLLCHVNLLAMNQVGSSEYRAPKKGRLQEWQTALKNAGIQATIRNSRGQDINGACGQLANKVRT